MVWAKLGWILSMIGFSFKHKTAYEITVCLEFRRVLFRSCRPSPAVLEQSWGATGTGDSSHPYYGSVFAVKIGRASCRERGATLVGDQGLEGDSRAAARVEEQRVVCGVDASCQFCPVPRPY